MTALRFLSLALAAVPAFAQMSFVLSPGPSYTSGTTLLPITAPDLASFNTLSGGGQTVTFSSNLQARTVPATWVAWGAPPNTESSTPRVAWSFGALTVTATLAVPATTFGFEIEPANPGTFTMTARFLNGTTQLGTITRSPADNGALLLAATSVTPITSVEITAQAGSNGFAIAQVRFAVPVVTSVPTASTSVLSGLALALLAGGALLARRQQLAA